MKIQVFSTAGQPSQELALNASTFGKKFNPTLVAQAIRVYLANQRSAFAKSLSRGQVSGTTKKMWAQKGTGNARHGSAKAPQFVGGGKAHGPDGNQNYKLKLSKKMRQAALKSVLSSFAHNKAILAVEKITQLAPKTKAASALITNLKGQDKLLSQAKNIGLITVGEAPSLRAFRNIPRLTTFSTKSLNVYDLSKQNYLIFTKKALNRLNK